MSVEKLRGDENEPKCMRVCPHRVSLFLSICFTRRLPSTWLELSRESLPLGMSAARRKEGVRLLDTRARPHALSLLLDARSRDASPARPLNSSGFSIDRCARFTLRCDSLLHQTFLINGTE
jgi:hypothetical protein